MKTKMKTYYFFPPVLTILLACPLLLFPQWTSNTNENTPIKDTLGEQILPKIVVNNSGESYISWFSNSENFNYDVYLQKLDPAGNKLWADEGLLISNNTTDTWVTDYNLVLDNEDCAILVNQDKRTGSSNVFAYRISADGQFLWGTDGIALTNDWKFDPSPMALATNDGGAIFAWTSDPMDSTDVLKMKIEMQKVSKNGDLLGGNGIILGDTTHYFFPQLLLTEDDNFIVSWLSVKSIYDTIMGQNHYIHVFAQKFGMDGNPVWPFPVQVDSGQIMIWLSLYTIPYLENDASGGAYIMWQSYYEGGPTTRVNRIDANGNLLWPGFGKTVSLLAENGHSEGSMSYNPSYDGLFVVWIEYHFDGVNLLDCFGVYGQLFSSDGQRIWGDGGKGLIPLNCTMDSAYSSVVVQNANGSDVGVFYSKDFLDIILPDTFIQAEYYAVRVDMNGNVQWGDEPVTVSKAHSTKFNLVVSDLVHDQWIAVWSGNRNYISNPDEEGIYAQNIFSDGSVGPLNINETGYNSFITMNNFPNPFTCITTIKYELDKPTYVDLSLADLQGRYMRILYRGYSTKGEHYLTFDATDLDAGMYLYTLRSANEIIVRKMLISK